MVFQRWEGQVTKNQRKSLLDIDTNYKNMIFEQKFFDLNVPNNYFGDCCRLSQSGTGIRLPDLISAHSESFLLFFSFTLVLLSLDFSCFTY